MTHPPDGIQRPDGSRATPLTEDSWLVQGRDGSWWAEASDVAGQIPLDAEVVERAGAGVSNYAQAAIHAVRNARLEDVPLLDEAADEAWGCAFARALRGVA